MSEFDCRMFTIQWFS